MTTDFGSFDASWSADEVMAQFISCKFMGPALDPEIYNATVDQSGEVLLPGKYSPKIGHFWLNAVRAS